jgi:hypothetical protein
MQHSAGSNAFAWSLNVSTSVLIVFANKVLLSVNGGHGFTFGELKSSQQLPFYSLPPSQQLTQLALCSNNTVRAALLGVRWQRLGSTGFGLCKTGADTSKR